MIVRHRLFLHSPRYDLRACFTHSKMRFADEPVGNLGAATGSQAIELMLDLNRAQGTTLILVTHDEALVKRCGRQLRLEAGRGVS
jgi:putative ABC transport system ATP-binding protein